MVIDIFVRFVYNVDNITHISFQYKMECLLILGFILLRHLLKLGFENPNFILLQHFHFSSKNTLISYLYIQWFQNLKFNSSVLNSTPEQRDSLDVQWKQGVIGCFLKKKIFKRLMSSLFLCIQSSDSIQGS